MQRREREMSNYADGFEYFAFNAGKAALKIWKYIDKSSGGKYQSAFLERQTKAFLSIYSMMDMIKDDPRYHGAVDKNNDGQYSREEAHDFATLFNDTMVLRYGSDIGELGPYAEDLLIPQMTDSDAYLYLNSESGESRYYYLRRWGEGEPL
jgi:hypothetical protein